MKLIIDQIPQNKFMMMQQRIQVESVASTTSGAEDEMLDLLPEEFTPGKWDVICQRGKECYDHGK